MSYHNVLYSLLHNDATISVCSVIFLKVKKGPLSGYREKHQMFFYYLFLFISKFPIIIWPAAAATSHRYIDTFALYAYRQ